jgi:TolB-like protein
MKSSSPDVRAHMERIAESAIFAESGRLQRFLRFTVEAKLRGEHERLKEYVLGREVFDRRDGYDPRLDPIVRVEARRLRSKLSDYYSGPGQEEPIRIAYPKGTYVPVFAARDEPHSSKPLHRRILFATTVLALFVLGLLGAYAYRSVALTKPRMLAVLPAQWLSGNDEGQDASAIVLSEALDAEIANRNFARVIAWPIVAAHHDGLRSVGDVANRFGASKIIAVSIRRAGTGELITIFLIDSTSGEKLRAAHYFVKSAASYWMQTEMATRIANDLHSSGHL